MNRRSFFNILGSAVIGTAIALKIPESLVPNIVIEKSKISYKALEEAYMNCSRGAAEPSMIFLNIDDFDDVYKLLGPLPIAHEKGGIRFRGAQIVQNKMFNQPQGEIQVTGGYDNYNCNGRFYF